MSYRDTLIKLAAESETQVKEALTRLLEGDVTEEELRAVAVSIIGKANQRAASLASISLAATLELSTREPVPVIASAPNPIEDVSRLAAVVATARAIIDPDGGLLRLGNLARQEPIESAATAYSDVIKKSDRVEGWVRSTEPDACGLCQDWADGDIVWPSHVEMLHHTGCTCTQTPITN